MWWKIIYPQWKYKSICTIYCTQFRFDQTILHFPIYLIWSRRWENLKWSQKLPPDKKQLSAATFPAACKVYCNLLVECNPSPIVAGFAASPPLLSYFVVFIQVNDDLWQKICFLLFTKCANNDLKCYSHKYRWRCLLSSSCCRKYKTRWHFRLMKCVKHKNGLFCSWY